MCGFTKTDFNPKRETSVLDPSNDVALSFYCYRARMTFGCHKRHPMARSFTTTKGLRNRAGPSQNQRREALEAEEPQIRTDRMAQARLNFHMRWRCSLYSGVLTTFLFLLFATPHRTTGQLVGARVPHRTATAGTIQRQKTTTRNRTTMTTRMEKPTKNPTVDSHGRPAHGRPRR